MSADDQLAHSTQTLVHSLQEVDDEHARGPSLLPGWTRGHVLAHIARNADAFCNLVAWARTGVETPMYPSREIRSAIIEEQSGRPAAELVVDVIESAGRLAAAYAELTPDQREHIVSWGTRGRSGPASMVITLRRTEVEMHHVDLGLDYTVAHWPEDFVEMLLADIAAESQSRRDMPDCVLIGNDGEGRWVVGNGGQEILGPPPALLGWITGRSVGDGLHSAEHLPEIGSWR